MFWVEAVPPCLVERWATFLWRYLEKACSRGADIPPEVHVADCASGVAVFWVIGEGNTPLGVCVTRKVQRPDALVIEVTVLGGERGLQWVHAVRQRLHQFREAEGADRLVVYGRKGWCRVFGLAPVGFVDGRWIIEDFG